MPELLRPGDQGYPLILEGLEAPSPLWVEGEFDPHAPTVAIVGARHPSPYGMRTARRLAATLAESRITIVSGLALGVDAAAHIGALEAAGVTLAVLGTGIDQVHPMTNHALHRRIAETGALVSSYPPGTPPRRHRFLERNALIAALAQVVVVVEGVHPSSGALSTAARARDLGREVLGVPGPIDAALSSGPNRLIRDGCGPCLDAVDVLAALRLAGGNLAEPVDQVGDRGEGRRLMAAICDGRALPAIAAAAGMEPGRTADLLLDLELRGLIRRDTTGGYALV